MCNFWERARMANEELADATTVSYLTNSAEQLRALVQNSDDLIGFVEAHFKFDLMLSNLGAIAQGEIPSQYRIKNLYSPLIIPGLGQQQALGALTMNGKLFLSASSRYPVSGFLLKIEQLLSAACGGDA